MTSEQQEMLDSEIFKKLEAEAIDRIKKKYPRCRRVPHWLPLGWDSSTIKGFEGLFVDSQGSDHIVARILPGYSRIILMMIEQNYTPESGWQ